MASNNESADDRMLEEMAKGFCALINVKEVKEKEKCIQSLDQVLSKLEKTVDDVDLIRIDSAMALDTTMNEIRLKCQDMERYFDKIDKLEAFMGMVKKQVNELESAVSRAESELKTNPIQKALSTIPFLKKIKPVQTPQKTTYEPMHIFDSNLFFTPNKETKIQIPTTTTTSTTTTSTTTTSTTEISTTPTTTITTTTTSTEATTTLATSIGTTTTTTTTIEGTSTTTNTTTMPTTTEILTTTSRNTITSCSTTTTTTTPPSSPITTPLSLATSAQSLSSTPLTSSTTTRITPTLASTTMATSIITSTTIPTCTTMTTTTTISATSISTTPTLTSHSITVANESPSTITQHPINNNPTTI